MEVGGLELRLELLGHQRDHDAVDEAEGVQRGKRQQRHRNLFRVTDRPPWSCLAASYDDFIGFSTPDINCQRNPSVHREQLR